MQEIFNRTFGGLTRSYYLRQLFFGSLFMVLIVSWQPEARRPHCQWR